MKPWGITLEVSRVNEAKRNERRLDRQVSARPGYDALWLWFGLSHASWLTMPRSMMHAMPDDWQARMAELCREWDATWDSSDMPTPQVQAVKTNGRFAKWPEWLLNYRHPDAKAINTLRANP